MYKLVVSRKSGSNTLRLQNDTSDFNSPGFYSALPFSTLVKAIPRRPKDYPEIPKTLGQHLVKVRIDRHLTKKAVAVEIGVTPASLTAWEKEDHMPEVIQMKNVISFLGFYPLPEPKNLAEQIRKYRNVHGLTLEEFGKLLGVDGATVWTWENEKYIPAENTVQKINDLIKELSK